MKIARPNPVFHDQRGIITDILTKEKIEYVTLITSLKGSVRGNHYHKKTHQYVYLLLGKLELITQMPGEPISSTIIVPGDLVLTVPMEAHAIVAVEDSTFIVLTRGIRGGANYEMDTFRLKVPLVQATT